MLRGLSRLRRVEPAGLLLALTIVWFALEAWPLRAPLDDAYISFRYARNLATGHGLVFNSGERVEGITNLLWTLLVAGGVAAGFEAVRFAHALELLIGAGALVAVYALARALLPGQRPSLAGLAPLLLMAAPSFLFWSTLGMGTALFLGLAVASLAAEASERPGAAAILALLATCMRPEGALVGACVLGRPLLRALRGERQAWRWPLVYAAGIILLTLFRLAYYGSPVPNTFYAKVGGIPLKRGIWDVRGFLVAGAWPLLLLAVHAALARRRARPAAVYVVMTLLYVAAIGGDVFGLWRFLLAPLACLVSLALCSLALTLGSGITRAGVTAGLVALSAALFLLGPHPWAGGTRHRNDVLQSNWFNVCNFHARTDSQVRVIGNRRARGEPTRLVAAGAVGALGYYLDVPIVDYYGILDPQVARSPRQARRGALLQPGHQRSHADYVLGRSPDYVVIPARRRPPLHPAVADLLEHPLLERHYEQDRSGIGYRRRDLPRPTGPPIPPHPPRFACSDEDAPAGAGQRR
jgi:hypothetical protein